MQNFDEDGNILNVDYLLKQVNENIEERDMMDEMLLAQAAGMLDESSDLKLDLYGQLLYTAMRQDQEPEELKQWLDNAIYLARRRLMFRVEQLNLPEDPDDDPIGSISGVYGAASPAHKKYNLESCRVSQIYFYYSLFKLSEVPWEEGDNAKSLIVGIGVIALEFIYRAKCFSECLFTAQRAFDVYESMDDNRWTLFQPEDLKMMKTSLFLLCYWSYKAAAKISRYPEALEWSIRGEKYVGVLEDAFYKSNYYLKRGEIMVELGRADEAMYWLDQSLEVPGLTPLQIKDAKRMVDGVKHLIEGSPQEMLEAAFGSMLSEKDKKRMVKLFTDATAGDLDYNELLYAADVLETVTDSPSIGEHTDLPGMKAEFSRLKNLLMVQFARVAMERGDNARVDKILPQIKRLAEGDSQYNLDAAFFLLRARLMAGEQLVWSSVEPSAIRLLDTFQGELRSELKDLAAVLIEFDEEELKKTSPYLLELFRKLAGAGLSDDERTPLALSRQTAIGLDILEALLTLSAMMSEADPDHEQWWLENVSRMKFLFSFRGQRMQKESKLFNFSRSLPGDTANQIRALAEEITRKNFSFQGAKDKVKEDEVRLTTLLFPLFQGYRPVPDNRKWEYRYPEIIHIETAAYMNAESGHGSNDYFGTVISVGYHNGFWRATHPDDKVERTNAQSYLSFLKNKTTIDERNIECGGKLRKALLPLSGKLPPPELLGVRSTGVYHGIPLDALPLSVDVQTETVEKWVGGNTVTALLTGPNSDLSILETPMDIKKVTMFAKSHFLNGKKFRELRAVPGEIRAVKEIINADSHVSMDVFSEAEFNRRNFLRISGEKAPQILHITTHGESSWLNPQGSHLIVSGQDAKGGLILEAIGYHDIMLMDLRRCDLVILGACSTHEGQGIVGEGIMGLSWAFKAAGAKAVIATRWAVRDDAASEFLKVFYENLCKKTPIARSFLNARRSIMRQDKWSHPRNWSAFQLIV